MIGAFGSSPRAWGQPLRPGDHHPRLRFIPTRVGTALARTRRSCSRSVHPHARGDSPWASSMTDARFGSSPSAWGQQLPGAIAETVARFIPTRVGTAISCATSAGMFAGSSPRAWGQPRRRDMQVPANRFIPTRVGTARTSPHPRTPPPVHPHARGDSVSACSRRVVSSGSSPRAWGQRLRCVRHMVRHRFIPTRVGTASRFC